jgi:hypothetical protein
MMQEVVIGVAAVGGGGYIARKLWLAFRRRTENDQNVTRRKHLHQNLLAEARKMHHNDAAHHISRGI